MDAANKCAVSTGTNNCAILALYFGAFQLCWISTLNAKVRLLNPLADPALKTALCQSGTIPILYLAAFFLVTGFFDGKTLRLCIAEAKSNYQRILLLPLLAQPLLLDSSHFPFRFLFFRPDWQIPFLCMAGFSWCTILISLGLTSRARVLLRA